MNSSSSLKLIILVLIFSSSTLSVKSQIIQKNTYLIRGTVTHNKSRLSNVNIINKNTGVGTKTDDYGKYTIKVTEGDMLQFSHIGYSRVDIEIRKNENIINISMIPEVIILEETVLKKVKGKSKTLRESDKQFSSSKENIDPRTAGYRISYLKGDEISSYISLTSALLAKVPSYKVKTSAEGVTLGFLRNQPVLWDVDGYVTDVEPFLILSDIKDIRILGPSAAVNYGMRCKGIGGVGSIRSCGGIILIAMKKNFNKNALESNNKRFEKILGSIKKINQIQKYNSPYSESIRNFENVFDAFKFCDKILSRKESAYHKDLQLMNVFLQQYDDITLFKNLASTFIKKYQNDTLALKALAFELHSLQVKDQALEVYKIIFNQGIKNAQSYRDLANILSEIRDYKNAVRLYVATLRVRSNLPKKNIDNLIYNELEWLYYTMKEDLSSKYKFIPNNKSKEEFSKDVRLVLEWNNPTASFNLEFNNKEKGPIIYQRDYNESSEEDNFSIEEFLISKLGQEDWDIDLTYFGDNKQATYFKVTCYYNWGKENQYFTINTFLLEGDYEKVELLKLSTKSMIRH